MTAEIFNRELEHKFVIGNLDSKSPVIAKTLRVAHQEENVRSKEREVFEKNTEEYQVTRSDEERSNY
jgi:hypothetical protein